MSAHIYKNAQFKKFAKKNGISDKDLLNAVEEIEKGLIDAELGGGVIKKRIAGRGKGKSGGFRTILLFKEGKESFLLMGSVKVKRPTLHMKSRMVSRKWHVFF